MFIATGDHMEHRYDGRSGSSVGQPMHVLIETLPIDMAPCLVV
jgi:hypothetical protein